MNLGIWKLIKYAYSSLLRPLVKKQVESTDVEWDDKILLALDGLFEYED